MAGTDCPLFMVVAYTGHRHLADEEATAGAIARVLDRVEQVAAEDGLAIIGVGSAAIGADTLVLEAMQQRGLSNVLKMPFSEDDFEVDASAEVRQRCLTLIEESTVVEYAPAGLRGSEAYLEAGLQTIEPADVLIAVWDGKPARGRGGTAQIVDAASTIDLPTVRIDPATGKITWPGAFDDRGQEEEASAIARSGSGEDAGHDRAGMTKLFKEMDAQAEPAARQSRLLLFRVILLHLVVSAVAICALIASLPDAGKYSVSVFEAAALIWALVLATSHRKRSQAWLDARYRAELCRSFLALWPIRRDALSLLPHPAGDVSMTRFHRDLEMWWRICAKDATDLEHAREHYRQHRLLDQRDWLAGKGRKAASFKRGFHRAAVSTTISAIACGIAAFILALAGGEGTVYDVMKALSMVLPLGAAAIFSFTVSHDVSRRAARYTELADHLTKLERRIQVSETWPALGRAVAETESVLLNELGEWHAMTRFAGRPH